MDAIAKTLIASLHGMQKGNRKKIKNESPEEREARIQLYAARVAAGLDIWTGASLKKDFVTRAIERGEA